MWTNSFFFCCFFGKWEWEEPSAKRAGAFLYELKQTIVNFLRTTKTATVDNLIVRACVCACVSTQHSICTTIYHIRHLAYPYFSVPKFRESSDWKNLSAHIRSISSFIVFNRALSSHLCLFYWNYSNSLVCWIGYIIYYLLFPQSQCSPLWPSYGCYCFEVFSISTVLFLLVLFVYLFVFFNLLLFVHMICLDPLENEMVHLKGLEGGIFKLQDKPNCTDSPADIDPNWQNFIFLGAKTFWFQL